MTLYYGNSPILLKFFVYTHRDSKNRYWADVNAPAVLRAGFYSCIKPVENRLLGHA